MWEKPCRGVESPANREQVRVRHAWNGLWAQSGQARFEACASPQLIPHEASGSVTSGMSEFSRAEQNIYAPRHCRAALRHTLGYSVRAPTFAAWIEDVIIRGTSSLKTVPPRVQRTERGRTSSLSTLVHKHSDLPFDSGPSICNVRRWRWSSHHIFILEKRAPPVALAMHVKDSETIGLSRRVRRADASLHLVQLNPKWNLDVQSLFTRGHSSGVPIIGALISSQGRIHRVSVS